MGFFKNLTKTLNPVKHIKEGFKNPGQSIKNSIARGLDPAGSMVREGRGQQAMPTKFNQTYDPAGVTQAPPQTPQTPYQPGGPLKLSAGAQQLYDDMKARMAARGTGAQYNPTITQQPAPKPMGGMVGGPKPMGGMVGGVGQQLADGGKVGKSQAREGCQHFESKAFERKSNGKIR